MKLLRVMTLAAVIVPVGLEAQQPPAAPPAGPPANPITAAFNRDAAQTGPRNLLACRPGFRYDCTQP